LLLKLATAASSEDQQISVFPSGIGLLRNRHSRFSVKGPACAHSFFQVRPAGMSPSAIFSYINVIIQNIMKLW
jgi:hypothetical protein